MFENLGEIEKRCQQLSEKLSTSEIFQNPLEYKRVAKEHSQLQQILTVYVRHKDLVRQIDENEELLSEEEEELREMARAEIQSLKERLLGTEKELTLLLLPKDPNDDKNILLEIRAGTGGEEAALFAADLFRMYGKYAESRQWKVEVLSSHPTGMGGLKEIIGLIQGERVYSRLKYEAGVHRVQRVPETETQGRIHTSAVTVAVLPEADEVDFKIDPAELRIDIFRSSGPGGQSVNTTDSAVRITHLPTGLVVSIQDEKSQHKNRAKAMKVLRTRLFDLERQKLQDERASARKSLIGSGDRSQKIRTYNFPQSRVSDHRINLNLHNLHDVLDGDLTVLVESLARHDQEQRLQALAEDI